MAVDTQLDAGDNVQRAQGATMRRPCSDAELDLYEYSGRKYGRLGNVTSLYIGESDHGSTAGGSRGTS